MCARPSGMAPIATGCVSNGTAACGCSRRAKERHACAGWRGRAGRWRAESDAFDSAGQGAFSRLKSADFDAVALCVAPDSRPPVATGSRERAGSVAINSVSSTPRSKEEPLWTLVEPAADVREHGRRMLAYRGFPRVRREARINAPETYRCTVHPRLCVHSRACRFAGPPASTATWSRRSRRFRPTPRLRLVPAVLGCSAARFRRSFARALRHTHRPVPARSHGLAALPAPAARPVLTGDLSLVAVDDLVCLLDAAHDASARPPLGDRPRPGQVVSIVPLAIGRSRCGLPSPGARRPVAQGSPRSFRQDGSTELIGYRRPRPHQPLVSAPCSSQGPRSGAIR